MPFVSVALCTYNGARYLGEQLASIAVQTRAVDEMVISDDRSTDETARLVADFARQVRFPVRFEVNPVTLGSTKNFEQVLSRCQGDIILFSDQDDRWREDRVARTLAFFEANPEMDAVFSNGRVMDGASQPTPHTIWEEVMFTPELREKWAQSKAYEILFNGYVVTGATLSIRKRALLVVLPFPTQFEKLLHDGWVALVLALKGSIGFIDDELIWYRQHAAQQVGFGRQSRWVTLWDRITRPRREKLAPLAQKADELTQLYHLLLSKPELPTRKLAKLRQQRDHFVMRASLPASRWQRLRPVWRDLRRGLYELSSPGHWWRPLLGDLFE